MDAPLSTYSNNLFGVVVMQLQEKSLSRYQIGVLVAVEEGFRQGLVGLRTFCH